MDKDIVCAEQELSGWHRAASDQREMVHAVTTNRRILINFQEWIRWKVQPTSDRTLWMTPWVKRPSSSENRRFTYVSKYLFLSGQSRMKFMPNPWNTTGYFSLKTSVSKLRLHQIWQVLNVFCPTYAMLTEENNNHFIFQIGQNRGAMGIVYRLLNVIR